MDKINIENNLSKEDELWISRTMEDSQDFMSMLPPPVKKMLNIGREFGIGKEGASYGYYLSNTATCKTLLNFIIDKKINTFLDLGCGMNILGNTIRRYVHSIRLSLFGIEYNKNFFDENKYYVPGVALGDITNIDKIHEFNFNKSVYRSNDLKKIKSKDCLIYFWEPLVDEVQSEKFAKALNNFVNNQKVIYNCSGKMYKDLKKYFDFSEISLDGRIIPYLYYLTKKK